MRDTRKAYKPYVNNEPSTMNKEWNEILKAVNFLLIHPTSTNSPSDKKVKSTPTNHATTTTRSSTWKENTTVTTMTTETVSQNDVKTTSITMQKNLNIL